MFLLPAGILNHTVGRVADSAHGGVCKTVWKGDGKELEVTVADTSFCKGFPDPLVDHCM